MCKWDVATVLFLTAPVRKLTVQSNKAIFEEEHIENGIGKVTELVVKSNVYRLRAKVLNDQVDGELSHTMEDVEMRALLDRAERPGP